MRHKIVFLLLAMLALLAEPRAATMCRGIGSMADISITRSTVFEFPAVWEASKFPTVRVTPGYGAVAWWHTSDGFEWTTSWAFCTSATCTDPALARDLAAALASSNRLAGINAVFAKYRSLPFDSGPALLTWCPHWDEMQRSRPTNPAYAVAKNGSYPTRPAYPYIASTAVAPASRGPVSNGRATVGATCDCRVRLFEGSTLYCAVDQARTSVAVCSKP
jgi:hypothetical protein